MNSRRAAARTDVSVARGPARLAEEQVASHGVVAWRTRHLVGVVLAAGLVLAGLTLVAGQANPDAVDLAATRWLQQFDSPVLAAFMAGVSWFGFAPQNLVMPVVLAALFAARGLWVEALVVLGSQSASLVTVVMKGIVHRSRPSPALVGVLTPLSDPSFPSGHVVQYTALFGVAFFLVYVLAQPSARRTVALEPPCCSFRIAGRIRSGVWMQHAVDSSTRSQPWMSWPGIDEASVAHLLQYA